MTFDAARLKTDLFMAEVKGNFRHARVDLDGDGEPESVLSVREAVGNGLFEPRYGGREEPLAPNHFEYDALLDARTGAPLLQDLRPFGEARWSGRKVTVCEGVAAGEPRVTLRFE